MRDDTGQFRRPAAAAQRPSKDVGRGRAPRRILDVSDEDSNAALEYEIAREKASSLGRLGRRLEAALAGLQAFDASHVQARRNREREALLAEAGTLLWHFIVQREACGLRDGPQVMQDYRVPNDVRARMGVFPKQALEER